jgi:hypothetical protein
MGLTWSLGGKQILSKKPSTEMSEHIAKHVAVTECDTLDRDHGKYSRLFRGGNTLDKLLNNERGES